jgi:hypothetical protein
MTRDRHRPPHLESLEAKRLLSTVTASQAALRPVAITRQTSTTAVDAPASHPNPFANEAALQSHVRISQGTGSVGRTLPVSLPRSRLVGRSASGAVPAATRLVLPAGLSGTVMRSSVVLRSAASFPTASLGTARIAGGPTSTPLTAPKPTATTAPPTQADLIAQAQSLPSELR